MKVSVVGKEHVSGISKKTGKPFDNNLAHISYSKAGVTGAATEVLWLDVADFPLDSIHVGRTYDLDRDNRGYMINFKLQ